MSVSEAENDGEVVLEFERGFKLYRDGRFERQEYPFIPPSLDDPKTGVSSKDVIISPQVSARIYLPKLDSPNQKLPVMVYYHGGGFCFESAYAPLFDDYMKILVPEARVVAVSVEYRNAPEHLLPAAFEDSWTALQWVASHRDENATDIEKEPWLINHGDFENFFLNGDSAGGNIVHNMLMKAGTEKLRGGVRISGAILAFPYFWGSTPIKSMSSESNLQSKYCKLWEYFYPSAPGGIDCPLVNPLADGAPSLTKIGCSRKLVITGELDGLRERGIEYVDALKKSNWKGEVELHDVKEAVHCFQLLYLHTEKARHLIKSLALFINM